MSISRQKFVTQRRWSGSGLRVDRASGSDDFAPRGPASPRPGGWKGGGRGRESFSGKVFPNGPSSPENDSRPRSRPREFPRPRRFTPSRGRRPSQVPSSLFELGARPTDRWRPTSENRSRTAPDASRCQVLGAVRTSATVLPRGQSYPDRRVSSHSASSGQLDVPNLNQPF
jgi:hypothetical protein